MLFIVCTYFRKATRKVYVYIYVYIFFFNSLLNCLFFYSIEFECLKHTIKALHLLLIFFDEINKNEIELNWLTLFAAKNIKAQTTKSGIFLIYRLKLQAKSQQTR